MTIILGTGNSANFGAAIGLLTLVVVWLFSVLAPNINAGSISEGFPSEDNLPNGTLVSIRNTIPTTLEATSVINSDYLLGVVEEDADTLLSIGLEDKDINVATQGVVNAFVSDVNGSIRVGDFIGASWIKGVGMKANTNTQQKLLGIAIEVFDDTTANFLAATEINTPFGSQNAKIGKIAVRLFAREAGPEFGADASVIENFANKLAGKNVAYSRVLAALGLFVVSVVISGIFLANAIHGSFISLGRNPLSSSSVFASLMQVSGVSISLVLIGAVLSYVILVI